MVTTKSITQAIDNVRPAGIPMQDLLYHYCKDKNIFGPSALDEMRKVTTFGMSERRCVEPKIIEVDLTATMPGKIQDITFTGKVDLFDEREPAFKEIVIFYDNGATHTERNLKASNVMIVESSDKPNKKYLRYERMRPVEVEEGVFQAAKFAIDMVNVAGIRVTKKDGNIEIKKFKTCCGVKSEFFKD